MFGGIQGIIATDIQSRQSVLHTTIKRDKSKNEVNKENSDTEEEEKLMNCNLNMSRCSSSGCRGEHRVKVR